MDKTVILKYLGILSNAQTGYKLCKASGDWYVSSGIFSALYRTVSGDSRNDILDMMDKIIEGLNDFRESSDIQARNEIILGIGEAISGCDKILETYKLDEEFTNAFTTKMSKCIAFKEPRSRSHETKLSDKCFSKNLRSYPVTSALTHTVGTVLNNNGTARVGVEYINNLITK